MPLNPGNQSLTFNPPAQFVVDRFHTVPASTGLSSFTQSGSMIQPITVKDKIDNTAYSEATDKLFAPYNSNTAGVDSEWYVFPSPPNGFKYRVIGTHHVADAWGRIYQCMFIVKKEEG